MWYALNRKMITSVDLLNKEVKDSDGITHDETDSSRGVFDNMVNEKEMIQFLQVKQPGTLEFTFKASAEMTVFRQSWHIMENPVLLR